MPWQQQELLDVWAGTRIQSGPRRKKESQKASAKAKVAVRLVSPDFLASEWINTEELPQPVETARIEGLTLLWIPWRRLLWEGLQA